MRGFMNNIFLENVLFLFSFLSWCVYVRRWVCFINHDIKYAKKTKENRMMSCIFAKILFWRENTNLKSKIIFICTKRTNTQHTFDMGRNKIYGKLRWKRESECKYSVELGRNGTSIRKISVWPARVYFHWMLFSHE